MEGKKDDDGFRVVLIVLEKVNGAVNKITRVNSVLKRLLNCLSEEHFVKSLKQNVDDLLWN